MIPLLTLEKKINMVKGIIKGKCRDLEKDPHTATGHTLPRVAESTHCRKRASISGTKERRQVATALLIGIHIAITVSKAAAGVIQRQAHPTPATTEVYMIALIRDLTEEGEAGTVRTEVTQGALPESSPAPPAVTKEDTRGAILKPTLHIVVTEVDLRAILESILSIIRKEVIQGAVQESSPAPPIVMTEVIQRAVQDTTSPIVRSKAAQGAILESTLPTVRIEVAQGAILESTPTPHIRHHCMMNMAGKGSTKQSIMRNRQGRVLVSCSPILLKKVEKRKTRSITKGSRGKVGVQV